MLNCDFINENLFYLLIFQASRLTTLMEKKRAMHFSLAN